jgi:acyl dehydratase
MNIQLKAATKHVDFQSILDYAALTNDYNPAHVDKEFADSSAMKGIIAHGTMSVALIWQAIKNTLGIEALNDIDLDIRFVRPVRIDDDVTGGGELLAGSSDIFSVWVRNQKDEDVIIGTAVIRSKR